MYADDDTVVILFDAEGTATGWRIRTPMLGFSSSLSEKSVKPTEFYDKHFVQRVGERVSPQT